MNGNEILVMHSREVYNLMGIDYVAITLFQLFCYHAFFSKKRMTVMSTCHADINMQLPWQRLAQH